MIGKIMGEIHHMTPYLPEGGAGLHDRAVDLIERSAALSGKLHPITLKGLIHLLQITNTYYSNLIENHVTNPIDIERAMMHQYDRDPAKRDLQIEAKTHVDLERELDHEVASEDVLPTSPDFIRSIHRRFFEKLPERFLQIPDIDGQSVLAMTPGGYRNRYVKVGHLVPVAPEAVPMFMEEFHRQYDISRFGRAEKLIAIAAAHHRLMWIHPFLDGNGRVARLLTGICLKKAGITGYGLWSISRGFARFKDDYMSALAVADAVRQGDLDGRGVLSQKGLNRFCGFFFNTCLDQITFMEKLLDLDGLVMRIEQYIRLRSSRLIPGAGPLRPEALHLIREAFAFGEFQRGQASRLTGLKERTARALLTDMVAEGLMVSDTPKGPVRLNFNARFLPVWFPDLGPHTE